MNTTGFANFLSLEDKWIMGILDTCCNGCEGKGFGFHHMEICGIM